MSLTKISLLICHISRDLVKKITSLHSPSFAICSSDHFWSFMAKRPSTSATSTAALDVATGEVNSMEQRSMSSRKRWSSEISISLVGLDSRNSQLLIKSMKNSTEADQNILSNSRAARTAWPNPSSCQAFSFHLGRGSIFKCPCLSSPKGTATTAALATSIHSPSCPSTTTCFPSILTEPAFWFSSNWMGVVAMSPPPVRVETFKVCMPFKMHSMPSTILQSLPTPSTLSYSQCFAADNSWSGAVQSSTTSPKRIAASAACCSAVTVMFSWRKSCWRTSKRLALGGFSSLYLGYWLSIRSSKPNISRMMLRGTSFPWWYTSIFKFCVRIKVQFCCFAK